MRHDIHQLTDLLKQENFEPTSFIEIGSRDGHDTHYIRHYFNINSENCFMIWTHNAYPYLNVTGCQFFALQSSYSLVQGRYITNITSSTPSPRTSSAASINYGCRWKNVYLI